MRVRLILSLLFLINFSQAENNTSGKVDIYLNVPFLLSLTILTPNVLLVPTLEDYAKEFCPKNYISFTGKRISWPLQGPYPSWLPGANSGWLERAGVIEIDIFTNSQKGVTLYVYGVIPTGNRKEGILNPKDCFLTVDTHRTFIWKNKLEGAAARVSTPINDDPLKLATEKLGQVYYPPEPPWDEETWTNKIKPKLVKFLPWIEDILSAYQKEVAESYIYTEGLYKKKKGEWRDRWSLVPLYIQLSNSNILWIFAVSKATIAPRRITFQIGVGNLDLYPEGDYTNNIVFILMPNV